MPVSKSIPFLLTLLAFASPPVLAQATPGPASHVQSPDGNVSLDFALRDGSPTYQISYHGKPVVLESALGFEPAFTSGFSLAAITKSDHASTWTNPFGERRTVQDNYHELDVDLAHSSGKLLRITFRAYDQGAAFRYGFPRGQTTREFAFEGEHTEFHLPPNTFGYEEHGTEGDYTRNKIADFQPWCERPLTLEFASGLFASLNEAANTNFPRMLLSPLASSPDTLITALGGPTSNTARGGTNNPHFILDVGQVTPWRFLILGDTPGDLLEKNDLLLNLNKPTYIADTSWIHPGKAMRDAALTTASAKAIVDLAPRLGIDYVGFDAHWYGPDDSGDATHVRAPNLDIAEVSAYAKAHNVRVCVYVDDRQVRKQRDQIFSLLKSWNVDAAKIGFVTVGSQQDTARITDILQFAADNHFTLDIHDGYRSTGIQRTYPNLLSVEGIQGNEHQPTPEHDCTLPFCRYVGGIGDYTVCYLDRRIKTTHAHQLAMGVVSFSPMQWLYWYDKPAQLDPIPPEAEFWRHMPTVWDDTRVLNGKIGEYATIARQKDGDWFIGTINNSQPRTLKIPLAFLAPGKTYTAHFYSDDDTVASPTRVALQTRAVNSTTILDAPLKAAGGQAIWIETPR